MTVAPRRVGLVTCRVLPEPDPDEELLVDALRAEGLDPVLLPWDVPDPEADDCDLCIFRSCWNAHERPDAFLAWLDARVATIRFRNPPAVVRWSFHKRYLLELEREGLPVVPTRLFVRGGSGAGVPDEAGWEDVVVKPAISASSWRTHRFPRGARSEAEAFLGALLSERDAMVQPYLPGVEAEGERAVVWIDGSATHVVRKHPRFAGAEECVSRALPLREEEREIAERAVGLVAARFGERPLYARVDLMPDAEGRPLVSELELIEPSLFLGHDREALRRFVRAIVREAATDP
ncbi:MAG: hypothetical protein R6X22_06430 [Gemmatimonadota bacterium]